MLFRPVKIYRHRSNIVLGPSSLGSSIKMRGAQREPLGALLPQLVYCITIWWLQGAPNADLSHFSVVVHKRDTVRRSVPFRDNLGGQNKSQPPYHRAWQLPLFLPRSTPDLYPIRKAAMSAESNTSENDGKRGQIHNVDELRNKGIRKVRVVGESQLQEMAREAAARAILELAQELKVSEEDRRSLVGRAQKQILDGDPGPLPQIIPNPVSQPDAQVAHLPNEEQIEESPATLGLQEQEMLIQLSKLISKDWRSELATVRDSHKTQVDRLEMRIEELTRALRVTDQVLTKGGESVVNPTSKLKPFDNKKEELLDQLFQANVALREISASQGAGSLSADSEEGRMS